MTKKELKKLAKEIATYERVIQSTEDRNKRSEAQNQIIRLADKVTQMEDMLALDIFIQENLKED